MITFYDIPSTLPEKTWAPNPLKARISLNYKGIPYQTEWVEFPDIEATMKRLGGAPTSKKEDGSDFYTLPAIHDSTTGKVITNSANIAEYLDATYPDTLSLFPSGTHAAIATLEHVYSESLSKIALILTLGYSNILNPPSCVYVRYTREQKFGKKLEDLAPPGPVRATIWKEVKEGLDKIAGFYDQNGEDKPFYFADTFSFADAIVIGFLACIRKVLGDEGDEWKELASWSNGRWGKLVKMTEALQAAN